MERKRTRKLQSTERTISLINEIPLGNLSSVNKMNDDLLHPQIPRSFKYDSTLNRCKVKVIEKLIKEKWFKNTLTE